MADVEAPRFPDEVSSWMVGGPEFKTMIAQASGGAEQRNSLWTYPLCRWDISAGLRKISNAQDTSTFHRVAAGRANAFRVKDPLDYTCLITEGFATALSSTQFQLWKKYTLGSYTAIRKIVKPLPNSIAAFVLKDTGTTLADPADYHLDVSNGVVTMVLDTRIATNLTWSGQFDVRARFDDDWLQIGLDPGGLLNYNSIIIREVR